MYDYIAIEGNIGAGKTTVSGLLREELGAKEILESFKDNPFLPRFYQDPRNNALPLELFFLAERYHQLKEHFAAPDLFAQRTVADYFIGKSLVFAKNNLDDHELRLFRNLYDIMFGQLPRPDLVVYLHKDIQGLQENIKKRGRSYEQSIADRYLEEVHQGYMDFLKQQTHLRSVILATDGLDFVQDKSHFARLLQVIHRNYPSGVTYVDLRQDI